VKGRVRPDHDSTPFNAAPKIEVRHKPTPPASSWWVGLASRDDFDRVAREQEARLSGSQKANWVRMGTFRR
jgi:hypothetical protein